MNSMGIAHSYWQFLKKHNNPAIEAGMILRWDGRDGSGAELPGGIYFAVMRANVRRLRQAF